MWKLVIEDDEGKRTVVPLTRDDYTIGRKEGNTIRLTERNVSRDHAKLSKKNANGATPPPALPPSGVAFILEDLTSYNGVYVNGLRVAQAQELTHGDLIQIGDYRIVLQDDAVQDVAGASLHVTADAKATLPTGATQRASLLMERPNRMVMLAGPTPGAEYPLDTERLTIGRAEDATISINHNSVSRLHCEIHSLGDGRYEIVDKGSSNGVRVNAAELRRGIIEAGDVVELGDVKFKFVGAGQIFRPGATDSQQLAAIGERTAGQIVGTRRSGTALPFVLFGVVVVAGAIGAWWFTRPKPEAGATTATQSTPTESPDALALAEGKKLAAAGKLDEAHAKIDADIAPSSVLRGEQDFKDIEMKWADALLLRAENEQDVQHRRSLYERVAKAMTVDAGRRKIAADKLQALEGFQSTNPSQLPMAPDAGRAAPDAGRRPDRDAGHATVWDAGLPVVATTPTTPTTKPGSGTDFDRESQLALQQGQDAKQLAKRQLEGRVYSGRGSTEEIRLLKALCKEVGDKGCVEKCRQILDQKAPAP